MEKQLSAQALDFAPDLLAIQERPPARMPRAILYSVLALFSVLLLWASVAKLDVIASAAGKLVPQSYLKIVQPADAGILKEIRVKEGDRVEAGQVLMRMDAAFAQADTRILESELKQRALQLRRVDAELAGKPLVLGKSDDPALFRQIQAQYLAHEQAYQDALGEERAALGKAKEELMAAEQVRRKLQNVLPTYQAQEEAWTRLGKDGFAGRLMVMDKQRERIEKEQDLKAQAATVESLKASIAQSEKRLAQITSNSKQQLQNERVQAQAQLERVQQELAKQQHRNALTELKAPQAGVIKDIATHTVGTVVSPGTILMTLVPVNDPLQAEVMVKNEDVGFVHVGQPVKLKVAAYPFQKYGMIEGAVTRVSADASEAPLGAEKNEAAKNTQAPTAYKAIVTLANHGLHAEARTFELTAGMQVLAEINQGERTILEYLLSPIQGVFHDAGRER